MRWRVTGVLTFLPTHITMVDEQGAYWALSASVTNGKLKSGEHVFSYHYHFIIS